MTGIPILASHFPFEQPPNWLEWLDERAQTWCFRACWIVKDLKLIYDLLNDPSHTTNYSWEEQPERLVHRIQNRLRTPGEQSVVLERQRKMIAYWEILPVSRTNLLIHCPVQVEGWVLYYLLPADFAGKGSLGEILLKILTYIKSNYSCAFNLLVEVPEGHTSMQRIWESIGFEYIARYSYQKGWVRLYRSTVYFN